jgi:hypothetical protein
MYFLRRLRPLEVAGERVRFLRVSLNAPVVSTPDLPSGPARAVIVVHREARGRMDATVGVRSLRVGEVAYWSLDDELVSDADLSVAADGALTFAESLGFLFDEETLSGAAAERAYREWLSDDGSMGEKEEPEVLPEETNALFDESPPEIELEELSPESRPAPRDPPLAPRPSAKPAPAPRPLPEPKAAAEPKPAVEPKPVEVKAPEPARPRGLSKFRARDAAPGATASGSAPRKSPVRQPLARVQLVKRRSPEDERKLVIRRLLTSF